MKNLLYIAVASLALMACEKETIDPGAEKGRIAAANAAANAANVVLPPSITASKVYRCKDNSLVYIDWLSDGNARVKTNKNDRSTPLTAAVAGEPMTAEGYSLTGSATVSPITLILPGKSSQTCHA